MSLSLIEDSLVGAENKAVTLKQGGTLLVVKDMEQSKEVGENMSAVVKRFIGSGMSADEAAVRMDVPESYIVEQLTKGGAA